MVTFIKPDGGAPGRAKPARRGGSSGRPRRKAKPSARTKALQMAAGISALLAVLVGTLVFSVAFPKRGVGEPGALVLMLLPGGWLMMSAAVFLATGLERWVGGAAAVLGLAMVGAALDQRYPGHGFLLLLLPIGVAFLAWAVRLVVTPKSDPSERRWTALPGALMFGISAIVIAFSDFY